MGSNKQWIVKARQYALECFNIVEGKVSEIENNSFTATFRVFLPGMYDILGVTKKGVKKEEPVTFIFPDDFPLSAPKIYLRDDFNRDFAHINPSLIKVNPCIYDGDLDELLQQPKWFDHILDQIADWFDKASIDNLIDPSQGWEPMRQDNLNGIHIDKLDQIKRTFRISSLTQSGIIWCKKNKDLIFSIRKFRDIDLSDKDYTNILYFSSDTNSTQDQYVTKSISSFSDLIKFATICKISNFSEQVNDAYSKIRSYKKEWILVSLNLRRPFNLINSDSIIESLFFAIEIKEQQKGNGKIHLKSKVYMISGLNQSDPLLYRRMSGIKKQEISRIVQIGVGSLGSKINLHLARNGTEGFLIIDNDDFSPHNNARHALFYLPFHKKAYIQKQIINDIGIKSISKEDDIKKCINNISGDLFIDSTANISVRNLLVQSNIEGPVVNTTLYNNSKLALMLTESIDRNPRVDDLMCSVYQDCLEDSRLRSDFFSEQNIRASIGQGCSTFTTICPDSRISLCASSMSAKIQQYISNKLPAKGEIFIGRVSEDDMNIIWKQKSLSKLIILPGKNDTEFQVRIFDSVAKKMEKESKRYFPKEYGGILVGHISTVNKTMTVTDLIDAPEDSIFSETQVIIGVHGLKKTVKDMEKKTNGLLTYLGTWHSHPVGGKPSGTDENTKLILLVLRDYEPTVCLIWTPSGIIRV